MFQGFTQQTIDFMWNIRFNNEKPWFETHKAEYKAVLELPMKELAREVADSFLDEHPDLDLLLQVSRIYRDARRLHGNGPYKDHLWFTLRQVWEDWSDRPVFWFELQPDKWSYGLGYYSASALTMAKHRSRIDRDPRPLEKLARTLGRQDEFILDGGEYARPKGDPGKLLKAWYNKKTFSLIHEGEITEEVFSPDLAKRIIAGFSFLVPFYNYFSSLSGDPDPRYG